MNKHSLDCPCFGCRRERKRLEDEAWGLEHSDLTAALPPVKDEARALLAFVQGRNGGTEKAIEEARQLIAVPPRIEAALRAYAASPQTTLDEREGIVRILRFRQRVAAELGRLLCQPSA